MPNNNLVSNIGFGAGAENTLDANSVFANIPTEEIGEITPSQLYAAGKRSRQINFDGRI